MDNIGTIGTPRWAKLAKVSDRNNILPLYDLILAAATCA